MVARDTSPGATKPQSKGKQANVHNHNKKNHKTWCASWWTRGEVRLLFKKIAFLNIFHTQKNAGRTFVKEYEEKEAIARKVYVGLAHREATSLNPELCFSFSHCIASYELERSHSGSHHEDGCTEFSWHWKGYQEAILTPLTKGISFSMKNDQAALAELPQRAKFNCKASSIRFPVLLLPSTAISVKQSHLCAFYLKSNRFPDTAVFCDRGSASISLEF